MYLLVSMVGLVRRSVPLHAPPPPFPLFDQVAEGVATASSVITLASQHNVSLPVLTAVANVVEGRLTPRAAVMEIMSLPQVAEV